MLCNQRRYEASLLLERAEVSTTLIHQAHGGVTRLATYADVEETLDINFTMQSVNYVKPSRLSFSFDSRISSGPPSSSKASPSVTERYEARL